MDKYQEFILQQVYHRSDCYTEKDKWNKQVKGFTSEKTGRENCGVFDFDKDVITIKQDEDILSAVYYHVIKKYYYEYINKTGIKRATFNDSYNRESWATDYLNGVSVTRDGVNWEELTYGKREPEIKNPRRIFGVRLSGEGYQLVLDFNDRVKKVKFSFMNGLADDYIMDVVYVEADKDKYYLKKAEEDRRALIEKAKIKVSTGASLVNICFAPCSDDYAGTEIELYSDHNLMAKYKVPEEQYFKSIEGLAYGSYSFVLRQYDKHGKIIFQTDEIGFGIIKPRSGNRLPDM